MACNRFDRREGCLGDSLVDSLVVWFLVGGLVGRSFVFVAHLRAVVTSAVARR